MGDKHTNDHDWIALENGVGGIGLGSDLESILINPRVDNLCPQCGYGHLDYDGLLNLVCQKCGYILAGCST